MILTFLLHKSATTNQICELGVNFNEFFPIKVKVKVKFRFSAPSAGITKAAKR